jgi:hypothetical protein
LANGSSSIRNVEGDALLISRAEGKGVDFVLITEVELGCLGADWERARASSFGGAVTGAVGEV